ncbi:putative AdoMet-dependent methyltransferase [Anaerolineales bacterium]|nr:putative AdoMet-dependent methyltransferase [Anaerolineales bacterium]
MSKIWNAAKYDLSRRRLIPCFDLFYSTAADLAARTVKDIPSPAILDIGAGTGMMSEFVMQRVGAASLYLLDESAEMTAKALIRLEQFKPTLFIQSMTEPLPNIQFNAVVSSVAIHHLTDDEKRNLYERIFGALAPGGVFVNAEQVLGETEWEEKLYDEMHIGGACALGSDEDEIRGARERMSYDKSATLLEQVTWLKEIGFEKAGTFFQWGRFAVFAGWK